MFNLSFGSTGSLYFKSDVPAHLQNDLYAPGTVDAAGDSEKYCIGPIADYMFWYGRRDEIRIHRGLVWVYSPRGLFAVKLTLTLGRDPKDYLNAIAEKEVAWTRKFGKPLENEFPHNTMFPGFRSHEDYLVLLRKYLAIAPYILPKDIRDPLNRPTIRHPGIIWLFPHMR